METDSSNAIIISPDVVDRTTISVMPRGDETALAAVSRQMATYKAINTLIDQTFVDGVDYDYMPGTSDEDKASGRAKKNLLLPGMEKARTLLGLREEYRDIHVVRDFETPFFYFEVECVLYSIATGIEVGRGQAVCHTREKSFMRTGVRLCPVCGKAAIKKSNFAPRNSPPGTKPGWYCHDKAGGCGANFGADDASITSQETGSSIDVQLVMDGLNRCRKIANKRAFAEPIKKIAMMSGRFTVDMEDFDTYTVIDKPVEAPPKSTPPVTTPAAPVTPPEEKKTPPPHWSDNPAHRKTVTDRAIENLYLDTGDTWEDALKLAELTPETVRVIAAGRDMGRLIEQKVAALRKPPTPFVDPALAEQPALPDVDQSKALLGNGGTRRVETNGNGSGHKGDHVTVREIEFTGRAVNAHTVANGLILCGTPGQFVTLAEDGNPGFKAPWDVSSWKGSELAPGKYELGMDVKLNYERIAGQDAYRLLGVEVVREAV
jgi:hypothetical protein